MKMPRNCVGWCREVCIYVRKKCASPHLNSARSLSISFRTCNTQTNRSGISIKAQRFWGREGERDNLGRDEVAAAALRRDDDGLLGPLGGHGAGRGGGWGEEASRGGAGGGGDDSKRGVVRRRQGCDTCSGSRTRGRLMVTPMTHLVRLTGLERASQTLSFFCLAHGSLENSANYRGLYASEQIAGIATAKCRRFYSPRGPLRCRRRRRCFGSALFPRPRRS
jgi:hypothetical protein